MKENREVKKQSKEKNFDRREFLKKAAKRSSTLAGLTVAAHLPYKKPSVDSFFGVKKAYAQGTGNGLFSLSVSHVDGLVNATALLSAKRAQSQVGEPVELASGRPISYMCTIEKVELYNGTDWIVIFSGSASKDYMTEGGWTGLTALPVPPGTYSKVRITFSYIECFSGQISYASEMYYTTNTSSTNEFLPGSTTGPAAVGCVTWEAYGDESIRTHNIDPVVISGPSDVIEKCYIYEEILLNMLLGLWSVSDVMCFTINSFPQFGDCPTAG
jgi:hypothetical protein